MFGAIMLAAALALFGFGRWLSRNDPAWLSQVIQNALSAEKSGSPAIPRGRFERTQIIGAVCLVLALLCWTPFVEHGKLIHVARPYPPLMRAMTAINGAILPFIGYGAFRKQFFRMEARSGIHRINVVGERSSHAMGPEFLEHAAHDTHRLHHRPTDRDFHVGMVVVCPA